ncbi:MAG: glycosyltransferase family 87 protein [Hyphomonadaceae bacterium]
MTFTNNTKRRLPLLDDSRFNSLTVRAIVLLIGAVLCALGIAQIVEMFLENTAYPANTDLSLYLRAADTVLAGGNPYDRTINTGFDIYGYPPLLADVLALMSATIGANAIHTLWPFLCAASLIASIVLVCRGFGVRIGWHWIVLIIGLLSLSRLVRIDIYHGQVNFFILLLVVGSLLLRARGQLILAALCLAIAMSLKPFFGILAIYFVVRKDWRMAIYSVGLGAVVFFLSFVPLYATVIESFQGWRDASSQLITGASGARGDNQSLYGLFLRMFTTTPFSTPWLENSTLVPVFTTLGVVVAGAFAWFLFSSPRNAVPALAPQRLPVALLECTTVLALSLACGPYTEGDHIFFTLAALAVTIILGVERWRDQGPHTKLWIATALAWSISVGFIALPKSVWFTLGTPGSYNDLSGSLILLSGRNGLLLLLAGAMTAITLGMERRSAGQQVSAA